MSITDNLAGFTVVYGVAPTYDPFDTGPLEPIPIPTPMPVSPIVICQKPKPFVSKFSTRKRRR